MKTIFNFQFSIFNSKKGFTLIELLIVISIIGILSGLLTVNFIGVKQRSRDAQRMSDLKQIQTALELYRSDQGAYYTGTWPGCGAGFGVGSTVYLQKVPCDPSGVSYTYASPGGLTYSIIACLENGNDSRIDKDGLGNKINCTGSTTLWRYTVTNP